MRGIFDTQLETQSSHQESQKHRATITHENFGGLKVPAQESCGCSKNRRRKHSDQRLSVQVGKKGEEHGSHRSNAGAQAVHVIENAERGGNANNPKDRQSKVQKLAAAATHEQAENLSTNAGKKQNSGGNRHANK